MPRSTLARRLPFASILTCIAVLGALTWAAPSSAAPTSAAPSGAARSYAAQPALAHKTGPVRLTASASPPVPSGAVRLGQMSASARLSIEVTLNVPHQAALTAFLNGLDNPQSPYYLRFLRPGQFGPRFGPSLATVAAVDRALRAAGLSPGRVSANRLAIPITGTVGAIERAFGVTLETYRLPGGRHAYSSTGAPAVPAAIAPLVQGVLGLSDVYPEQHFSSRSRASAPMTSLVSKAGKVAAGQPKATPAARGPRPCAAATSSGGNTANTFAAVYGMNLLYDVGDLGRGVKIGVAELEPNRRSDISAFKRCYRLSTKVHYIKVDGGPGKGAGSGEAALDIETIAALAPKASIDVYQAPDKGTGFYDIFKKFVSRDSDKELSVSWGSCEAVTPRSFERAEEALFEQANAQGQVIFAAAGDEGSTSCYNPKASKPNHSLSTLSPASAPYVIAVGGTSFANGKSTDQVVWNDSSTDSGAGGGGVSSFWCMPSYQFRTKIRGIINRHSKRDRVKSCKSKHRREVPDVSANGDPLYGYAVYYKGGWVPLGIGGTSAATPVWASVGALVDASPWCRAYRSRRPMLPQNLYGSVATYDSYVYGKTPQVIRDVRGGNNDYTPSGYTGGLYPAARGYDMASGLGTPMASGHRKNSWYVFLSGLTQVLCHNSATRSTRVRISHLSRTSGKAGQRKKITVYGRGFLPFKYADQAWLKSGSKVIAKVYAYCTTTRCKVTLPREKAQTVQIKIYASSLWSSRLTRKDRFTYRR